MIARRALLHDRQGRVGAAIVGLFVLVALLAPVLAPDDPREPVGRPYAPPGAGHLLGLDDGGVDVLSQLLYGARVSLAVGLVAALVAMLVGGAVGLVAGYFGGRTDSVLMRVTDYFLVIPDIPLMIVVAALFGQSLLNVMLIIGVIYWARTARLVRAQVKSIRERAFVQRARVLGAGNARLIVRHVLPHAMPVLIANTVLMVATAILTETYISFLGLGDPAAVSWGKLIQNAVTGGAIFNDAWWSIVPPGVAVTVVVLGCTLMGHALERALNPRLAERHRAGGFRLREVPTA